jgi:predicted DNA-binding transcriptional regulator YafY
VNRTDRLLAIVLELQGRGWQRAEDLAATFECSRRTIYRDLLALGEAGVPLVSVPGRGYSLMEGYFLPPLSFTTDEATMLLLGGDFMAQQFDAQYQAAARSAGRKIAGVLPEKLRGEVRALRESIQFPGEGISARPAEAAKLQQLRRAIMTRRTVRFRYSARYSTEGPRQPSQREADPYAIANLGGKWYLSAYCHLRQGNRHFRLERMDDLVVLERRFTRPEGFKAERRNLAEPGSFDVRARFDSEVVRWVREAPSFFTIAEEETPEGLLLTLRVRHENEVLQWLLSWGRHVHVLEPEALRRRLAEEAQAILAHHENSF